MRSLQRTLFLALPAAICASPVQAVQVGTEFTYQGQLKEDGAVADGDYDFRFRLYDSAVGGAQVGPGVDVLDWPVSDGLFTVELDFGGGVFDGGERWLEVDVRDGSSIQPYTTLTPRQPLTAAPYALYALGGPGGGSSPWELNGGDVYYNAGNVGIGTSSPGAKLDVRSSIRSYRRQTFPTPGFEEIAINGSEINSDGTGGLTGLGPLRLNNTSSFNVFVAQGGGNLGVGTASGVTRLHVDGGSDAAPGGGGYFLVGDANSTNIVMDNNEIMARNDGQTYPLSLNASGGDIRLIQSGVGRVGIGTVSPGARLHVQAEPGDSAIFGSSSSGIALDGVTTSSGGIAVYGNAYGDGNAGYFVNRSNTNPLTALYCRTEGTGLAFHAEGTARVEVLEITGADVAEKFPTSEQTGTIEPGTVMAIDPASPGELCVARGAYNRRVAGVVSGAGDLPVGAILGNLPGHDEAPPIALAGRVWVRCDTSRRAIEPGDLLTTSDTPGCAMAVTDHGRAMGAVIGKAMTSLDQGESGLVLVLVSLQ